MSRFAACFEDLPDPRGRNARHPLTSILFIAVAAIVCGAESCTDMADFGVAKKKWLKTIVPLPYGIPSHDTFSTVFRHLDPDAFDAAFRRLTASFAQGLEGVVAIDGKAVRGAYRRAAKATPLHFVNVWAAGPGLVIGQKLAPGRNEVQGALDALALLALEGSIVTADALHCRPDTARAILAAGGDYALALKANQPGLLAQALARIEDADHVESIQIAAETAHDRTETRRASVVSVDDINFPGLQAIGCVETTKPSYQRPFDQPCPLLPALHHHVAERADRGCKNPLANRKQTALGSGCPLPRGRRQKPQGQRPSEHCLLAQDRSQPLAISPRQGLHPPENQKGGLG